LCTRPNDGIFFFGFINNSRRRIIVQKRNFITGLFQRTKVSFIATLVLLSSLLGYSTIEQPTTAHAAVQKQQAVQILSVTSPAPRNGYATLKAKVAPGASASIVVHYKSGASKAKGLESKKANSSGIVSWTWKVGGNTTLGKWPITVSSNGKSATTYFQVVR
jgi:hypothetical protein